MQAPYSYNSMSKIGTVTFCAQCKIYKAEMECSDNYVITQEGARTKVIHDLGTISLNNSKFTIKNTGQEKEFFTEQGIYYLYNSEAGFTAKHMCAHQHLKPTELVNNLLDKFFGKT